MTRREPADLLAAEAWRAILDFIAATAWRRTRALADLGLTVSDSRALSTVDAVDGRSMRSLAEEWSCDASTATWIINRLVKRGFAERRAQPGDRRVRLVVLTDAGAQMRDEMLRRMYSAPPELLDLPVADLRALHDGVTKLPRHGKARSSGGAGSTAE